MPFRNAHILCVGVSWAEVIGAEALYIGAVQEDGSGYPDCREEFYERFGAAVDAGTKPETRIAIVTPLIRLDKAAIVRGASSWAPPASDLVLLHRFGRGPAASAKAAACACAVSQRAGRGIRFPTRPLTRRPIRPRTCEKS